MAATVVDEPLRGYLVDLGLIFVGTIITVFYVDIVVAKHEQRRRAGPRAAAMHEVRRRATAFVDRVAQKLPREDVVYRFQIPLWQSKVDPLNANRVLYEDPEWIAYIRQEVIPQERIIVSNLSADDIDELEQFFRWVFEKLREAMLLHAGDMDPYLINYATFMLQNLPIEAHRLTLLKSPGINQPHPYLGDMLLRSIDVIEEINKHEIVPIPPVWEEVPLEVSATPAAQAPPDRRYGASCSLPAAPPGP